MIVSLNDLKKGMTVEYQGELYTVVDSSHMFKGRGKAVAQTKLKHLMTGKVISETFGEASGVQKAFLDERSMTYMYTDGDRYYFLDQQNYEQHSLSADQIGEAKDYLVDNMEIKGLFHEGTFLKISLPVSVPLRVAETEPGVKGDTAAGGMKPATLETGLTVKVPLFIDKDEVIKVDTRDGSYIERA